MTCRGDRPRPLYQAVTPVSRLSLSPDVYSAEPLTAATRFHHSGIWPRGLSVPGVASRTLAGAEGGRAKLVGVSEGAAQVRTAPVSLIWAVPTTGRTCPSGPVARTLLPAG